MRSVNDPATGESAAPTPMTAVTKAPTCQRETPNSDLSVVASTENTAGPTVATAMVVVSTSPRWTRRFIDVTVELRVERPFKPG
jgi:hypothetical protein